MDGFVTAAFDFASAAAAGNFVFAAAMDSFRRLRHRLHHVRLKV
jgi:hypothetical protein